MWRALIFVAACTSSTTPAGARLSVTDIDSNLASMPAALDELMAGHISSNFGLKVSQLLFESTGQPTVWFEIDLYEPVATGNYTLAANNDLAALAAGEGVITYQELGAEKQWAATAGTVSVIAASGADVSARFDSITMAPAPYTSGANQATGSFTVSGTASVHDFAAM